MRPQFFLRYTMVKFEMLCVTNRDKLGIGKMGRKAFKLKNENEKPSEHKIPRLNFDLHLFYREKSK